MQAWADRATCAECNAPARPSRARAPLPVLRRVPMCGSQNTQYEINK